MINKLKYVLKKRYFRNLESNDIDMKELKRLEREGTKIIDVRSKQEYQEGHIQDAILIPLYNLTNQIEKTIPLKQEKIVVYCTSGIRSKKAQEILENLGYENVYNLKNGLET